MSPLPRNRLQTAEPVPGSSRLARSTVYLLLPILAIAMTLAVGYLKWKDTTSRQATVAAADSVGAATEAAVAMLSYQPATVQDDLAAAADKLTGALKDSYSSLTRDVVIPGAKQKQISAVATVPASATVSATPQHAVVLLFVNQTVILGNDPPTSTSSRVRVTLDKIDSRWLVAGFDPI